MCLLLNVDVRNMLHALVTNLKYNNYIISGHVVKGFLRVGISDNASLS